MRIVSVRDLKGLVAAGTFVNLLNKKIIFLVEGFLRKSIYGSMASQHDTYDYIVCG